MYSDSPNVLDALAETIEMVARVAAEELATNGHMEQTRYIFGADEGSFGAQVLREQRITIDAREMAPIVQELVSAVGLQSFRFTERQSLGKAGSVSSLKVPCERSRDCFR